MKITYKQLLKVYIGPFLLTFAIGVFVLLMQFIWKYIDDLVGKDLGFWTILEFLFYACCTFVPMAMPLAVLLSSLMVFGSMGEHYELTALKAAGIPLRDILRPLVVFSLVLSGIAFLFSNNVVPFAYKNYRKTYYEISTKKPAINIEEGYFYYDIDGYVIKVDKKKNGGERLEGVVVYDHLDRDGNRRVTVAKQGSMKSSEDKKKMVLELEDGYTYAEADASSMGIERKEESVSYPFTKVKFDKQVLVFDLTSFQKANVDISLFERHEKAMKLSALANHLDTLKMKKAGRVQEIMEAMQKRDHYLHTFYSSDSLASKTQNVAENAIVPTPEDVQRALANTQTLAADAEYYERDLAYHDNRIAAYTIEWFKKFSLSIGCLILFFVGAPLGSIIRQGGLGTPLVVSVFLFITYHVLTVIGEKAALSGSLHPFWGVWLASLVFLPLGIFLTYQATKDSAFLDIDTYKRWFTRKERHG